MKATYLHTAAALALTFAIAACSPGAEIPPPAPVARPAPVAPSPPPPPPVVREPEYANYLDAPQTPGTWFYVDEPGEKLALYGTSLREPVFMLRCADGAFALARVASAAPGEARRMSVTTESTERQLEATPVANRPGLLAAPLEPRDPLLDAMAITKGRFAIEVEGERTLYLPAWTEVSRVIEDCR